MKTAPTLRRNKCWECKNLAYYFAKNISYSINKSFILNFTFTAQSLTENLEKLFECFIAFHRGLS